MCLTTETFKTKKQAEAALAKHSSSRFPSV